MTPAELEAIGRAIHGEHWHAKLADDIHCDRTTVWRWANNQRKISRLWAKEIRALAKRKKIKQPA